MALEIEEKESEKDLTNKNIEKKLKPVEKRKSKVFEVSEKFSSNNDKPIKTASIKKIILPGISVDGARKEYERRSSLASGSDTPSPKRNISTNPNSQEESFPLASTVALNKLVESAFRDEPSFEPTSSASVEFEKTPFESDKSKVSIYLK